MSSTSLYDIKNAWARQLQHSVVGINIESLDGCLPVQCGHAPCLAGRASKYFANKHCVKRMLSDVHIKGTFPQLLRMLF